MALAPFTAVSAQTPAVAPAPSAEAIAAYRRALAEYLQAREAFASVDHAYWKSIAQKRAARTAKRAHGELIVLDDYGLTQPPKYTGPPRPPDPFRHQDSAIALVTRQRCLIA
jgi:hypothetical protein